MQARAFVMAVCAGVLCALVYGGLRCLRRAVCMGAAATGLTDLFFWVVSAAIVSAAGAAGNVEGLRLYMLLGALCGFFVWEWGVRRAAYAVFGALRRKKKGKDNGGG